MRDVKAEQGLGGDHNWPQLPLVAVRGDQSAQPWSKANEEAVIESWQRVVVLQVTPNNVPFHVGFKNGSNMQFLTHPIEAQQGSFGMKLGHGDVEFFVIPADLVTPLQLEVVEIISSGDAKYVDLPVY